MCRCTWKTYLSGVLGGLVLAAAGLAIGPDLSQARDASAPQAAQTSPAAIATARFTISNMTCPTCPITVKRAMLGVDGVREVEIDFGSKTATVAYDPPKTSKTKIAAASTNAGYPARAISAK